MDIDDWVFVIKPGDPCYGQKFAIKAIQTDFDEHITAYTVGGQNGKYRDYAPQDLHYSTPRGRSFTHQMQLL